MKRPRKVHKLNHMCIDIKGALRWYAKSKKKKTGFTDDNGRDMSASEVREELKKLLETGKRVIPMGKCYRFCDQKGCRGHIISLMPTADDAEKIEQEYQQFLHATA